MSLKLEYKCLTAKAAAVVIFVTANIIIAYSLMIPYANACHKKSLHSAYLLTEPKSQQLQSRNQHYTTLDCNARFAYCCERLIKAWPHIKSG